MRALLLISCSMCWLAVQAFAFSAPVAAQSTGELSQTRHSRAALDLGFYYGENATLLGREHHTVLVPSLAVNLDAIAFSSEVSLSFDVALRTVGSIWKVGSNERSDLRAGNLYLGARVAVTPLRGLRVRGGFGVAAPVLNTYADDDFALISVPFTALPNGGWDPWMFMRGDVPLVFRADGEYREDWFFFGGETALALGVPVMSGREGLTVGAQLGVYGGVRPIPQLAAGLRLQAVLYDPARAGISDPSAIGFFSMAPFVRGELDDLFAELRFFIGLADNDPYRLIGEKAWGLYLQLGADFDVR